MARRKPKRTSDDNLIIGIYILSLLAFLVVWGTTGIWYILLDKDCLGYLKRAADSNTIELARQEMEKALDYIEAHNLTNGYTSVIYRTPDEDIGFWYNNLTSAKRELDVIATTTDATSLEKSNVLMKLRETLLDHSGSGEKLTCPQGLSIYPHNKEVAILLVLFFLVFTVTGGWKFIEAAGK